MSVDRQYEMLLRRVRHGGVDREDRTGVGTRGTFGERLRFDLTKGFPRVTSKYVAMKPVKAELLWFLSGQTNVRPLQAQGVRIWDEWADADGELGPVYGSQWRSWPDYDGGSIDQIGRLVESLKVDPFSRRHIVSAWNVGAIKDMALPPCHVFFQCYVQGEWLSLQVYQRSADLFLGVPFNIASYALLTHMLAQQTGHVAKELVWLGGDVHVYHSHFGQVDEQLRQPVLPFPRLRLRKAADMFSYTMGDIDASEGYVHGPTLRAPVAV